MADSASVDSLLKLTRRLSSALIQFNDPFARQLEASVFQLDHCLTDLRKSFSPTTSLLWIEDVIASLDSLLRHLSATQQGQKPFPHLPNSTTITSSNDTPLTSSMSPTYLNALNDPLQEQSSSRINHHSHRQRCPPHPNYLYQHERRHTHIGATTGTRSRRRSLASLFTPAQTPRHTHPPSKANIKNNNNTSNSLHNISNKFDMSRSLPSVVLNNPFSERLISSFARLVSPFSTNTEKPPPSSEAFFSASRTVDEWVTAVRAAKEERTFDDTDSGISISDALPPLPQNYMPCRDALYKAAQDALLKAVRAAPPSSSSSVSAATGTQSSHQPATAVALYGPHGVGKTMLAMELVHDLEICHNFADGVAWIQLGPDITDEELAENMIRCVETILAGDYRSSFQYYPSIEAIISRASRLLRKVCSLVVIDDVSGPRAQRAFDLVTSALGPSCVILYTTPCDDVQFHFQQYGDGHFNGQTEKHNSVTQNGNDIQVPTSESVTCVAKLAVSCLEPDGQEAMNVFRNWLTKSTSDESRDGALKHVTDQSTIIHRCFGLPLALAMAGGFLSRFHNSWTALATALSTAEHPDDAIFRILRLLHAKGGSRFEQQLKAIGCLPQGMWVSLSALADLWETDYRTIKVSARRLGRMAFGEYRLSDSSDESRVRFHYHVVKYCIRITKENDVLEANQRLLTNLSRRRGDGMKMPNKIEYLPWWSGVVTDKYLCRRLHWHLGRCNSVSKLNDLICDYQWVCQRLENDSLLGLMTEFKRAILVEERNERKEEFIGISRIATAFQEVARMRENGTIEMNALPTFFTTVLARYESRSECISEFLSSMYEKARRPWLRPITEAGSSPSDSFTVGGESISSKSAATTTSESYEMPYVTNCLASSISGKVICGDALGNVHVYDPASGKKVVSWTGSSMGGPERWRSVGALGTVQDFVISGHYNGLLMIRSIRSGRTEVLQDCQADGERFTCIGTSEDGTIAVGSYSGTLFILKGVHGLNCRIKRIELEGHCHMVTSLYVFPDKERIASSSFNGFAAIWKLRANGKHERISLNGHKPDIGHKENYITTFASVANGKRLLSACRAGVVSAWNSSTGECVWTRRYGYEFSRSSSLHAFGVGQFAGTIRADEINGPKGVNGLRIGYPYLISRGEGPRDLLILAAGEGREVVATVTADEVISTWLEVWHPSSRRIFIAVSHADGKLCCYELVTSLR